LNKSVFNPVSAGDLDEPHCRPWDDENTDELQRFQPENSIIAPETRAIIGNLDGMH
jgi:hypothetical protein